MNREGYKDPTAEKAIRNVARNEVTKGELIRFCQTRPQSFSCDRCEYDAHCSAFIRETGHVPYTAEDELMTDEVIKIKRRRK